MENLLDKAMEIAGRLDACGLATLRDHTVAMLLTRAAGPDAPGAASGPPAPAPCPARLFTVPPSIRHLDVAGLARLEEAVRRWSAQARNRQNRLSRQRLLLIFLVLRYAGAKLGEVLAIDDTRDFDGSRSLVAIRDEKTGEVSREVVLPEAVMAEAARFFDDPACAGLRGTLFRLDAGFVRRKLSDLAGPTGLPRELLNPTSLRHSRAVELLRAGTPLPVLQTMLGHSSLALTAIYYSFSEQASRRILNYCIRQETPMKTSARNTFTGVVTGVRSGPILTEVTLSTRSGNGIVAVITNTSLENLGLAVGSPATAIVKAPWMLVGKDTKKAVTSARNAFPASITAVRDDGAVVEVDGVLDDGTPVCALITTGSAELLDLKPGDPVWYFFKAMAVILTVA